MNTDHLWETLQLSESSSMNKTAAELYMTQPCLSRHIDSVEKELGIILFARSPTGTKLTEPGKIFIASLKEAIIIVEQALDDAKRHGAESDQM